MNDIYFTKGRAFTEGRERIIKMPGIFICEITDNVLLTDAVFSVTVACRELASQSVAGQFLHIKCGEARILRRPISICCVRNDEINFIFEVKGEGTRWLSGRCPGDELDVLGPLGNGFSMPKGKLLVVGGGVGTPPMLFAAESAKNAVTAILGFRNKDRVILVDEFKAACEKVYVTTDDGSEGIHGAVTKPLEELLKTGEYESVLTCGQLIMQKAVAVMCEKYVTPCQVSLEERMGCGIGACLVCACLTYKKSRATPDNTAETASSAKDTANENTVMSRACKDGPVFDANAIVWEL